ncbi:hypothetical protein KUTeg_008473 [Tegillarca granosa]|uniref:Uncharacterized protein n=1 Tax=Tegillarca granosa TaxID=220873 RepID=A0ABQ9F992_TEGGR|nr:hypothetical protein KUTeg_008473 [Tegillarca granosa]
MAAEWRVSRRSGRGVFSGKDFGIGEFLFEYRGSLKQKEAEVNIGDTYVYEFCHKGKTFWIDSTEENG